MPPSGSRPELRLLGGATLLDLSGAPVSGPAAQRHRLALLAVLALARPGGVQREKLVGLLWPERDEFAARRLLRVALHALRHELGPAALHTAGDEVRLDPASVAVDVHAFEDAVAARDHARAIALYGGPLLDGLFLDEAHEFDDWVARERARLAAANEAALEAFATAASERGDAAGAAAHWRALAALRRSDGRVALRLVEALAAAGDRGGALAHAEAHAAYLREEFGVAPEPALVARTASLRRAVPLVAAPVAAPVAAGAPAVAGPVVVSHVDDRGTALRRRYQVALALALVAILVGSLALRARTVRAPGGPDVLAVAPFEVVAGVPSELRTGLPALLAANLDQVPDIRTIPARLSAARADAVAARVDVAGDADRAALLARALGGDVVITGVVAPTAGGVVVRAALVDTSGARLARVEARGRAEDLSALVDDLTLGVLRTVWGRRWRLPAPRLTAVSTASAEALRDYLRGEAHFRAARWDSAALAFTAATARDSTFALAYVRLAETQAWRTTLGRPAVLHALAAARRHADRLPPRERVLLLTTALHEEGDLAALDSAAALAARYPDDPDALYARADTRIHASALLGERDAWRTLAAFDTAVAADPRAARVYAHPLTLALELGDSVRFDRLARALDSVERADRIPGARRVRYAALRRIRWGAPAEAFRAVVASVRDTSIRSGEMDRQLAALVRACFGAATPRPDLALAAYDSVRVLRRPPLVSTTFGDDAVSLLAGLGHVSAARAHADTLWRADPLASPNTVLLPTVLGYAPPGWLFPDASQLSRAPWWRESAKARRVAAYWRGLFALAAGDAAAGRAALHVAADPRPTTPGDSLDRAFAGAIRAALGWARLVEGDTAGALHEMSAGLRDAGYTDEALSLGRATRARHVLLLATVDSTRDVAIDHMRYLTRGWYGYQWAWWHRELARALAAEGRRAEADAEWRRFAALWAGADPAARAAAGTAAGAAARE